MRSRLEFLLIAATFAGLAATLQVAAQEVHTKVTALAREITYTSAALFPTEATQLGIPGYDAQLEMPSEANRSAYLDKLQQWQKQLGQLAPAGRGDLTLVDRDDARLLGAQLATSLNALRVRRTDRKDYSAGANLIVGTIFNQLQFMPVAGRDGKTVADVNHAWNDVVSRLAKAPQYIAAAQAMVTEPGHLYGTVGSEELAGARSFFAGALTDAAKAHYGHDARSFARFVAARDATVAAVEKTKSYIDAHVAQWPENFAMGRRAYDEMLRDEQLLPLDARDVERMADDELAHGTSQTRPRCVRRANRRRPGARGPRADRFLSGSHRRAGPVRHGARSHHRTGVAGLHQCAGNAAIHAAGIAGRIHDLTPAIRR